MKEHTCTNCKQCPAGIDFTASSVSEAVALNDYVILYSLCTCYLCSGVQREKGQTFEVGVVFLQALGDYYFDSCNTSRKELWVPFLFVDKGNESHRGMCMSWGWGGMMSFTYLFAPC